VPGVEVDDPAVVVTEVAQQPPQSFGSALGAIGDDEDARPDPGRTRRACEGTRLRQRMTAAKPGRRREVGVDVQEARAGNVSGKVELAAALGLPELPATVDELVAQTQQATSIAPCLRPNGRLVCALP